MAGKYFKILIFYICLCGHCFLAVAADQTGALFGDLGQQGVSGKVKVGSAWSADGVRAGDRVRLAVVLDVEKGFHINADASQIRSSGDFRPVPTQVAVASMDAGLTVGLARYPKALAIDVDFIADRLMAFGGRTVIVVPVTVSESAATGIHGIRLDVRYQACDDQTCLFPQTVAVAAQIRVTAPDEPVAAINAALFAGIDAPSAPAEPGRVGFDLFGWTFALNASSALGLGLLLATSAFGGMLLNFTPCVLPMVPIKIISLTHAADQNRRRSLLLGLFMFAGVLAFWLGLGLAIAFVSGFTATNQLFQYPAFTVGIGLVIAVMALGMLGIYHTRLPNFIYMINPDQESLPGSFVMGILTAVLSTPCTAPFMGAAAAWAATRPPAITMSTFAAIGIGMALPYLVFSAWPGMVRKVPRSGAGSLVLKQVMGLLMLAAAAYFIGGGWSAAVAEPPDPPGRHYWWAVVFFCVAAGTWMAWRTARISRRGPYRRVFITVGVVLAAAAAVAGMRLTDKGPVDWVHYTPERFEHAVAGGNTVVMVFTAEWCLNCKALEQSVLRSPKVAELLAEKDVVPIKVDITGNHAEGKAKLRQVGSLTIPLLVVFSPEGVPIFKSDFYTVDQVIRSVGRARRR